MKPQLLFGKVFHARLIPVNNAFSYGIYYLVLPLSQIHTLKTNFWFKINRWGLMSFYFRDHIPEQSDNLEQWKNHILNQFGITQADGETLLVTMPRIFGYTFNPVSFWICLDRDQQIRAVICSVNNTYGEKHDYVCCHSDQRVITPSDRLIAHKIFHVSPFIQREGTYQFRFHVTPKTLDIAINFHNTNGDCLLTTSLAGHLQQLTGNNLGFAFIRYPLVTFMVIFRIHWQAFKLFLKKIRFIDKPKQHVDTVTRSYQ
ncbi:MAG: DUF1365 domain-containing protein [Gammaproteobacteria bacterium]|nr:DUF1365 domain-containing protein [Gammaproteobacteria bacterium]